MSQAEVVGRVVLIRRYPVKSMLGETLEAVEVGPLGLRGDRAYALIDVETGRVVSAKNPKRWPGMFGFEASYQSEPPASAPVPPAWIAQPDGSTMTTDDPEAPARLSMALGRPVRIAPASAQTERAQSEGYWPDHDFLEAPDTVFDFALPEGTFFDEGAVHLVTTATLVRLAELAPTSRIDVRRFRPNLLIDLDGAAAGFVEDGWIGRSVRVGDEVVLKVTGHCPRCVMTTLPQADLPHDPAVLRAAVQANGGNVGVYAAVERPGRIQAGDLVRLARD